MKIFIIGVRGRIGYRTAIESIRRGHCVIGVGTSVDELYSIPGFEQHRRDVSERERMIELMRGCDVVFNAIAPRTFQPETYCDNIKHIIAGCKAAGVPKLLSIIGSSSALVGPGTRLLESDYFEESNRDFYENICQSEEIYASEHELDWGCITPAAFMECDTPVRREYRKGDDWLVIMDGTPEGSPAYFDTSQISLMDFAYACVDELEKNEIHRRRCCVGYPNAGEGGRSLHK